MSAPAMAAADELDQPEGAPAPPWKPLTRIGFRFVSAYLTLFCVIYPQPLFALLGIVQIWLPDSLVMRYADFPHPIVEWVGRTVFGTDVRLNLNSGSGDQAYLWVLTFCVLALAVVVTAVWSLLDRRRTEYRGPAGWFLLFIRIILAGQMLGYGFAKFIPLQMPVPTLSTLVTPYGDLTHMGVLWNQVGTSPVYESLLGLAEIVGGVLLLLPRTQLAGAMLSLVSMAQVWILNMTFDVPVKLLSFHLMLLSLALLAPDARRLTAVLLGRSAAASTAPTPFRTPRSRRISDLALIALLFWMTAACVHTSWEGWHKYGPGRPQSELLGVWNVTELTRDGQSVPPLLTDETRWRRIIFDNPEYAEYQRMNDSLSPVLTEYDSGAHRLTMSEPTGTDPLATFTYERPAKDRLILTGELDGHPVTMTLTLVDSDRMPVRQGGLHLVQDEPDGVR
ncbi:DoxX family protein [Nocardia sp. NBC_01503]|uniref:DoxX family protein n=1 Tax=Nocardia sp. NBC_01503 TaxID=2975997 RepID=UPI002E7C48E5|nr:DoxX family protein [Nocardia sp. NBC_01503]WTL29676.1 DoxX family protein [Nocardia sp. NBC_01503]